MSPSCYLDQARQVFGRVRLTFPGYGGRVVKQRSRLSRRARSPRRDDAAGQSCTKAFLSATEAAKATERLIEQKCKKGYREVSAEEAAAALLKPRVPRRAWRQLELPF